MRIKLFRKNKIIERRFRGCLLRIDCILRYYVIYEDDIKNESLNANNIIDLYVHRGNMHVQNNEGFEIIQEGVYETCNGFVIVNGEYIEIQALYDLKRSEFCAKENELYIEKIEAERKAKELHENQSYFSYFFGKSKTS